MYPLLALPCIVQFGFCSALYVQTEYVINDNIGKVLTCEMHKVCQLFASLCQCQKPAGKT